MYGFGSPILYRVFDTHFCTHRDDETHEPMGSCIYIFCKTFMTFMIYMVDILVIMLVFVFFVYDL
jgi:hypothetical protein